ncbi:MAG: hypothetical protein HFJ52_00940 [Clostridia bacterium]|nr:hypothetical protein [Clostridia bacterium]
MYKQMETKTSERGITLIALLIMIIILVILATVVIRALFGNESLIKTGTNAKEDYKYTYYGEQITQIVQGEIVSKSAIGEIASIQNVQEALIDEEWVKTAKIDEGWTEEEGVIIVRVVEGYIYQVYYNSKYGKIIVDNLGKDIPEADIDALTVKGRYQKSIAAIFGEAEDKVHGVKTLDLIYRDEPVLDQKQNLQGEQRWNVASIGSGWYKIKGTSNSGAIKYAYVKVTNVSDTLKAPTITIEPEGEQKAGWYGADGKELWVRISTDSASAKEIHYTLTGAHMVDDHVEQIAGGSGERSIRIQITETGITNIIACTGDGEGYVSEESTDVTKFDNIAPEIIKAEIEGTQGENGWHKSAIVNIALDAVDLNGKTNLAEEEKRKTLDGYTYRITTETDQEIKAETHETDINKKISITNDGKYKVYIRAIDQAGNKSEERKIEINKDSTPPTVGTPRIDNITGTSFRINISAGDDTSGVASYEYKINGTIRNVPNVNTVTITGLNGKQSYNIGVIVKDNAGNIKLVATTATTANTTPTITANFASKTTNSITFTAIGEDIDGDQLTYKLYVSINGTNWGTVKATLSNQTQGISKTLTANGLNEYTYYYWKIDVTDGVSTTSTGKQGWIRTYCQRW